MSRSTDKKTVHRYLPGLAVLAFMAAAATQGYKQIGQSDEILDRAQKTGRYLFTSTDNPKRGTIYSAEGEILAQNQDTATVGIRFDRVPNSPGFFMAVAETTGIPAAQLQEFAADPKIKSREWRKKLGAEQVRRLEQVKNDWRADGLSIHRKGVREYPLGASLSSVIGIVDESKGSFGLEKSLEDRLGGTQGKTVGIIDKDGEFLPMRLDRETIKRVDGRDVVLTIDAELQVEATSAVRRAVEKYRAKSGVAIVMDPKTGDLLALANWPSFDPEDPSAGANDGAVSVGVNQAYMMAWEPGSTFKVLTLALALDEGKTTPDATIACSGALNVWPGINIHCDAHNGTRAHGIVDSTKAIAKSCNVSAATWAQRIGHERFVKFIDDAGLTSKTGIPVTGETGGQFNRKEYAKKLQVATFGFGQSITVTPLGMIDAFSAIANKGVRMAPRIVKSIGGKDEPTKSMGQLLKPETCDQVLQCMKATIESDIGTGRKLRVPGYEMGGKTGTAEKIGRSTVGKKAYVSNFVGYIPALDPKAIVLVMIDDPQTAYYGAEVAGPVFLDIAKRTIKRLRIPPTGKPKIEATKSNAPVIGEANQELIEDTKAAPPKRGSQNPGPRVNVGSRPLKSKPNIEIKVDRSGRPKASNPKSKMADGGA